MAKTYLEQIELQHQEVESEVVDSSADSVGVGVHPERSQKPQKGLQKCLSPSFSLQSNVQPRFPQRVNSPRCGAGRVKDPQAVVELIRCKAVQ